MRLIDAEYLKEHVFACATNGRPLHHMELSELFDAIDDVPTIEERKTGKWQRKYSRPGVYADLCWHCSICGGKFSDTYANMWKYCPDCGAKMEEEQ